MSNFRSFFAIRYGRIATLVVLLFIAGLLTSPNHTLGGGSGLNTMVVVNQASTNSCDLGNYYCERREVPPENLLRINWTGAPTSWTASEFEQKLLNPLLSGISSRRLTNQIDYVVLSMDIPFQTVGKDGTVNSTTSALFYGLKPDPIHGTRGVTNSYAGSESVFGQARPATAQGWSFLATMITAESLDKAKFIVDQGASGDHSFPAAPAILEKSSDPLRNIRYTAFDNAIFNTRVLGNSSLLKTNSDGPPLNGRVLGYQTGLANLSVPTNCFVPGAIADSLTSYGGVIFGPNAQTSLLALLGAGAAGSYGTVAEPFTDAQKFPDPHVYFCQARGFTLAESYYQSVTTPFLGLIVGEPLAAPFAIDASGSWTGLTTNEVLTGVCPLSLRFSSTGGTTPVQQIDLFVDGKFNLTITNVPPAGGNRLTAFINGYPVSYTVPANAHLNSIAAGLAASINAPAVTNITRVTASAHGDRIELRSCSTNIASEPFYFLDTSASTAAGRNYRISYLPEPELPVLANPDRLLNGVFELHTQTAGGIPGVIEASTDLVHWLPIWTNAAGGPAGFIDMTAPQFPRRFYRTTSPARQPVLAMMPAERSQPLNLSVFSGTTLPYLVQVSTNFHSWFNFATNLAGGSATYPVQRGGTAPRFFRTALVAEEPTPASVTVAEASSAGVLLRVQGAVRPFTIDVSTNAQSWSPVYTNRTVGRLELQTESSAGTAAALHTLLTASRSSFLESFANGIRRFNIDGTAGWGAWLRMTVTLSNGYTSSISVTNGTGESLISLAQRVIAAINSAPGLQGHDGVAAEDFSTDVFGAPSFELRARSPGLAGNAIQAQLTGSTGVWLSPSSTVPLNENQSDLQPRNHLYVAAGTPRLGLTFSLDTTTLADGFHDLTATAYKGDNVRAQTRSVIPVRVSNSKLAASLVLLDLPENAPVEGTYHIQVNANTNAIARIDLFSTGGLLDTITNQAQATFTVQGRELGAGLHPFYAELETTAGLRYRTETHRVRLVR